MDGELKGIKKSLKLSFSKVKNELDGHLDSINENTTEVQNIYDYLQELDGKIDKLSERIDEISMYISPQVAEEQFSVDLTHREQEVFVILYSSDNKITPEEIAKRVGFTDEMVNRYIYNLISKGIPIFKQFIDGKTHLYLDLKFKALQAKKNVLKIDESISKQLLDDDAI